MFEFEHISYKTHINTSLMSHKLIIEMANLGKSDVTVKKMSEEHPAIWCTSTMQYYIITTT